MLTQKNCLPVCLQCERSYRRMRATGNYDDDLGRDIKVNLHLDVNICRLNCLRKCDVITERRSIRSSSLCLGFLLWSALHSARFLINISAASHLDTNVSTLASAREEEQKPFWFGLLLTDELIGSQVTDFCLSHIVLMKDVFRLDRHYFSPR